MIIVVEIERPDGWSDYESTVRWSDDSLQYKTTVEEVVKIALESYPEQRGSVSSIVIRIEDTSLPGWFD